jgi:hypothetical protein
MQASLPRSSNGIPTTRSCHAGLSSAVRRAAGFQTAQMLQNPLSYRVHARSEDEGIAQSQPSV